MIGKFWTAKTTDSTAGAEGGQPLHPGHTKTTDKQPTKSADILPPTREINRSRIRIKNEVGAEAQNEDDLDTRLRRLRNNMTHSQTRDPAPPEEFGYEHRLPQPPPEDFDYEYQLPKPHHREDSLTKRLSDCMEKISARSEIPPAPIEIFDGDSGEYLFFIKNFQDKSVQSLSVKRQSYHTSSKHALAMSRRRWQRSKDKATAIRGPWKTCSTTMEDHNRLFNPSSPS